MMYLGFMDPSNLQIVDGREDCERFILLPNKLIYVKV